jgi:hypothetical protein
LCARLPASPPEYGNQDGCHGADYSAKKYPLQELIPETLCLWLRFDKPDGPGWGVGLCAEHDKPGIGVRKADSDRALFECVEMDSFLPFFLSLLDMNPDSA